MAPASRPAGRDRLGGAVRRWPILDLPRWLLVFVLLTVAADIAAIITAALSTSIRGDDLELFAVLLACDVATVELTRRGGEPAGLIKETHAVWELPLALLLPPLFGLIAPIARIGLTQWRVRRALAYRRIFTAAALGLTYAAASVAFRAISPALTGNLFDPSPHVLTWAAAAILCGLLRSALNKLLVMTAVKGADPSFSVRAGLFTGEALFGDAAELSVGVLVAFVAIASPILALLALPCVTLLQRSQRHSQLVSDARIDGKTGLLNAVTWQREAGVEVMRASAARALEGGAVAVAMVDVDNFKRDVNDLFGHQVGDVVLAAVAGTIRGLLRDGDLCGRFGGDEFAILLPDTTAAEAEGIAQRLCSAMSQTTFPVIEHACNGESARVTVSIGVAALDARHRDLDELVAAADHALYQAKTAGRNTVRMISG